MWWKRKSNRQNKEKGKAFDFFPSLKAVVEKNQLDVTQLKVAFPANEEEEVFITNRQHIFLESEGRIGEWDVNSLRDMFRGSREPPNMERYPEEYVLLFYKIESNVLTACEGISDITDDEIESIYNAMRKRPDGRSGSVMHDVVYQSAALLLGMQPLSQYEFEAIFGQLARSVRNWKQGQVSRNYVNYLRNTFCK